MKFISKVDRIQILGIFSVYGLEVRYKESLSKLTKFDI
jgi:hypothetical protein